MYQLIEVAALRIGGDVPLGIMTLRQALKMPHTEKLRYRYLSDDRHSDQVISRQELEKLVEQSFGSLS